MDSVPHSKIATLLTQINADPLLPRPNPTSSFWQLPAHPELAHTKSPSLPSTTDYAIIGSGITGCSIAHHLLIDPSFPRDARVTVLEARTLCSGATGRNGGALTSWVPYDFLNLCEHFGEAEAIKIARYAFRTLEKMHALGNSTAELKDASEVRRLRDIVGFGDTATFDSAVASFKKYEELVPDCSLDLEILSAERAGKEWNLKNVAGAVVVNNGAFWPYRLVTRVWAQLLAQFPDQLTIETETPVTAITTNNTSHPYTLQTPSGPLQTTHLIHATNGYTGHLLPHLRGKIHPLRGTMSVQHCPPAFGHHGSKRAWSISLAPSYDAATETFEAGLYYSNQNPKTQDIFIGGEKVALEEIFVADDTLVRKEARENIENVLPRYFEKGWDAGKGERPVVKKVWSGIMGFTSDGMPLVGKLHGRVTGREGPAMTNGAEQTNGHVGVASAVTTGGPGEYIAAGFNGYGMPQCWSVGEAVAKIVLGKYQEEVKEWLPDVCLCTDERLLKMSAEASLAHMTGLDNRRC